MSPLWIVRTKHSLIAVGFCFLTLGAQTTLLAGLCGQSLTIGSETFRRLSLVEKEQPVTQCEGLCYVESAITLFNKRMPANMPTGLSLSRVYIVAKLAMAQIKAYEETWSHVHFYESFRIGAPTRVEFKPGTVDILSGGSIWKIQKLMETNQVLLVPKTRGLIDIHRENQVIGELVNGLGQILFDYRAAIRRTIQLEKPETFSVLLALRQNIQSVSLSFYDQLRYQMKMEGYPYSYLEKIITEYDNFLLLAVKNRQSTNLRLIHEIELTQIKLKAVLAKRNKQLQLARASTFKTAYQHVETIIAQELKLPGNTILKATNWLTYEEVVVNGELTFPKRAELEEILMKRYLESGELRLSYVHIDEYIHDVEGQPSYLHPPTESFDLFSLANKGLNFSGHATIISNLLVDSETGNLKFLELRHSWGPYRNGKDAQLMSFEYFYRYAKAFQFITQ